MRLILVGLLLAASVAGGQTVLRMPAKQVDVRSNTLTTIRSTYAVTNSPSNTVQAYLEWMDDNWPSTNGLASRTYVDTSVSNATSAVTAWVLGQDYLTSNDITSGTFADSNWVVSTFLSKSNFNAFLLSHPELGVSAQVFRYVGSNQYYTIPATATQLEFYVWGAGAGAAGGYSEGVLLVTNTSVPSCSIKTGTVLTVEVGPAGLVGTNGYGYSGHNLNGLYDAGGRSAIWTNSDSMELLVAGGSGAGAATNGGGGLVGGTGNQNGEIKSDSYGTYGAIGYPGTGGAQTNGGAAGSYMVVGSVYAASLGNPGARKQGGAGVIGLSGHASGSGGGGYYGGGSGGLAHGYSGPVSVTGDGSGGGGSGYVGGVSNGVTTIGGAILPARVDSTYYLDGVGRPGVYGSGAVVIVARIPIL